MLGIYLDRESELPLRRQIYQALRDQMTCGILKAGEPLPSTRELSGDLNVARSTVSEAYEMLIAEGFVLSSQGAPTRVAEGLAIEREAGPDTEAETKADQARQADFRTGRPDLRQFPRYLWQQMVYKATEEMTLEQYGYSGAQGIPEL
jgi:GntR family transcriptional regulator/MocR family aminotransferase